MHAPVLLAEVVDSLRVKPGSSVIDCTMNGGGHAIALLKKIMPGGKLLGIEYDPEIFNLFCQKINEPEYKWALDGIVPVNDSYRNIEVIALKHGFLHPEGILFDFGISSFHVDSADRGFTFQKDQALDMRFSHFDRVITAASILNDYPENDLADIFYFFGEERFSRSIAHQIVQARRGSAIRTTFQLNDIIRRAVPAWYTRSRIHFATKVYQALRIAVNEELTVISEGIQKAFAILPVGGRIAAISFHSLEDRIIKQAFKSFVLMGSATLVSRKAIVASREEIIHNPRARSAKLRVIEKI